MLFYLIRLIETRFWAFLVVLLVFRFAFIRFSGLDLVGDEAYYWDWSRHPDWCYYSKPPMIAWLIGAVTWALGDSTAMVRLPAVLLGGGFLVVFYRTAEAFYSTQAAVFAVLLLLATPANAISNLIMTIDPPLYFFWIVSLYFLYQALFRDSSRAWWLAGVFAALAFLSKPTAIALPCLLGAYLLFQSEFRSKILRQYLYFLLPVLVSFLPIIIWNSDHEWIMFQHNQSHFEQEQNYDLVRRLSDFIGFIALQLVLYSPVIWVLLLMVCANVIRRFSNLSAQEYFLLWMGPIPLLAIFGLSVLQKVQGNWPMPFYFPTLLLLSGRMAQGAWSKWLKPALFSGYAMVLLAYALPFSVSVLGLSNTALDPTYRLRQWQMLAQDVDQIRQQVFNQPDQAFILVDGHRYLVSELAFYLPDHPRIFRLAPPGKIESQYELWPGPINYVGKDALVLSGNKPQQLDNRLRNSFQQLTELGSVVALPGSRRERHFYAYLGKSLKNNSPVIFNARNNREED